MNSLKVKKAPKLNQVKPTRMNRRFGIKEAMIRDLQAGYTVELPESTARKMAKERYIVIVVDDTTTVDEPQVEVIEPPESITIDVLPLTSPEDLELGNLQEPVSNAVIEDIEQDVKEPEAIPNFYDTHPAFKSSNKTNKSSKKGK